MVKPLSYVLPTLILFLLVTLFYITSIPPRNEIKFLTHPSYGSPISSIDRFHIRAKKTSENETFMESQIRRHHLLDNVCKKYKGEMSRPILKERFLISNKHRLLYCCNAKVGTTTWKAGVNMFLAKS